MTSGFLPSRPGGQGRRLAGGMEREAAVQPLRSGLSPNPMTPDTALPGTAPRGNVCSPRRGRPRAPTPQRPPGECGGLSLLSAAQPQPTGQPRPHHCKGRGLRAPSPPAGRAGTLLCEEPKFREVPLLLASVFLTPQTRGPTGGHASGSQECLVPTPSPKPVLRAPTPHCLPPTSQRQEE